MNKQECQVKVEEIAENIKRKLIARAMRLYSSGGIDPEPFSNNYVLPRILIVASSKEIIDDYTFPSDLPDIMNLRKF